jgi:hypothetical protein
MLLHRSLASVPVFVLLAACSSGGNGPDIAATPPSVPSLTGTTVSVTFAGAVPNAAAISTMNGVFVPSTLAGNQLRFLVPAGTNTYAFAVACPAVNVSGILIAQHVYQANLSDGTAYTVAPCIAPAAATGAASGTYDISAIPGAVKARIAGSQGYSGDVNGIVGAFNVSMPTGANDVAVLALDAAGNVLAVKMVRSQIVPGAINAGATIVVTVGDEVTYEPVTITGVPRGFTSPPVLDVTYLTANGTLLTLTNAAVLQYPALSFADLSALDQYRITSSTAGAAINETIGTSLFTSTGTPVTLTYPAPWLYTPPAAAQFPAFSFIYSGFSGLATQTYRGRIAWQSAAGTVNSVTAYATAASLGIQTFIAIPNLAALPGFFGSARSGTTVNWLQQIDGGSFPSFLYPPPVPGSLSFVQASGSYIEP